MTLADHLGDLYAHHVLSHPDKRHAPARFVAALDADPDLRAAAVAKLAELDAFNADLGGRLDRRCHFQARHREFLTAALGDAPRPPH